MKWERLGIMSKLREQKVITFRNFEEINENTSKVFELAWPVEVVECYANKVSDKLDALAEAVLELLHVPEMTKNKVAEYLMVGIEVIHRIVGDLSIKGYYNNKEDCLTEKGLKYLKDYETSIFSQEKVFGNMFISLIDGEILPYFHEGPLSVAIWDKNVNVLSFEEKSETFRNKNEDLHLIDKINRAYHLYGRIARMSKDKEQNSVNSQIDFCEEELHDRSFREAETKEPQTLADVEEKKEIQDARIKILKTERKRIYIKTRVIVEKANPERFIVEPPFLLNYTPWYSYCFQRMRNEDVLIYDEESQEVGLEFFCDKITKEFYADYPEMKARDFEQYLRMHFPTMRNKKNATILMEKYREIFNLNILCEENKGIKRHMVITECAKAIEVLLNCYIASLDKNTVIQRYQALIRREDDIEVFFDNIIEIPVSKAKEKELHAFEGINKTYSFHASIMHSFSSKHWIGKTILEKYYFLLVDAYFHETSNFRKLLIKEGNSIIEKLDYINEKRNKYGAHMDGVEPMEISKNSYQLYQAYFNEVTKVLIKYMD